MRALAGLQKSKGAIRLKGRPLDQNGLLREAAFMPSDRHAEGLALLEQAAARADQLGLARLGARARLLSSRG